MNAKTEALQRIISRRVRSIRGENPVFRIPEDEYDAECYFCGKHVKGEMYLTGPSHSPYNAEANYHCEDHLDTDVTKHEGV